MSELGWVSWSAWALIVIAAAVLRSYAYALYRAVVLGLHTLIFLALAPSDGVLRMVALGLHALVYFDSAALIFPELRPLTYRLLVSWPAQYFAASTLLAFPWAIAAALGLTPHGAWLPYLLGTIGLLQSLTTRAETRSIEVGAVPHLAGIARVPKRTANDNMASGARPLRIVQITDPHLGPFMPVGRLRRICQRAVDQNPDLIVLTGDFLTMESQRDATHLSAALAPLRALSGRTFACFGNHDHEAPRTVCQALHSAGIVLLKDDATSIVTPAGRVQIVGFDFHFRGRAARMDEVSRAHPREPGAARRAAVRMVLPVPRHPYGQLGSHRHRRAAVRCRGPRAAVDA